MKYYVIMIKQLGGLSKLKAMLGIDQIFRNDDEKSIAFTFKGCRKINSFAMKLNEKDLYDLEFTKTSNKKDPELGFSMPHFEIIAEYKDIYVDQLRSIFEEETGLYLSLYMECH